MKGFRLDQGGKKVNLHIQALAQIEYVPHTR